MLFVKCVNYFNYLIERKKKGNIEPSWAVMGPQLLSVCKLLGIIFLEILQISKPALSSGY